MNTDAAIPVFSPLFTGELAKFGDRFVRKTVLPSQMEGRVLANSESLSILLGRYAAHSPGGDMRAMASLWAKCHFETLLVPFLALSLVSGRTVNVKLTAIGCTFAPDGTTRHIHLSDVDQPLDAGDFFSPFQSLIDGHLVPLVGALSVAGGVSRKVLWSNAGNLFEGVVRRIEQVFGTSQAVVDALALLEARRLPDGRANPLLEPVRYLEKNGVRERVRRVCCIRYLARDRGYCLNCPLPQARRA